MANPISVITDSSCSLPPPMLNKYKVRRVPLKIFCDDNEFFDPCDDRKTLDLFKSGQLSKKNAVSTAPPSPEDFEKAIMKAIDDGGRTVVVQTVNRTQGETYNNANMAASSIRKRLNEEGHSPTIRVMDSRTVFAGQGLMIAETIRRTLAGHDPSEVRRTMDKLSSNIHTFVLPKEPLVAFDRAKTRNEKAVGRAQVMVADTLGVHPILCIVDDSSYLAAKHFGFEKSARHLFKHACKQIEKGLKIPLLSVNYGGPVAKLKALPGFDELQQVAAKHKIQIMTSVMSIAGGIYTSVGSISLAFASEPCEWEG